MNFSRSILKNVFRNKNNRDEQISNELLSNYLLLNYSDEFLNFKETIYLKQVLIIQRNWVMRWWRVINSDWIIGFFVWWFLCSYASASIELVRWKIDGAIQTFEVFQWVCIGPYCDIIQPLLIWVWPNRLIRAQNVPCWPEIPEYTEPLAGIYYANAFKSIRLNISRVESDQKSRFHDDSIEKNLYYSSTKKEGKKRSREYSAELIGNDTISSFSFLIVNSNC